jgi:uncharacterized Tic20 family protein
VNETANVSTPNAEERNWAVGCHLAALSGLITGIGFILGPLIVWLVKKDESAFVSDQGKEALNFQITMALAFVAACALIIVVIGIPLLILIGLFNLLCIVMAAVKASEGTTYRYPLNLRLIK